MPIVQPVFQPIFDATTGVVSAYELLARGMFEDGSLTEGAAFMASLDQEARSLIDHQMLMYAVNLVTRLHREGNLHSRFFVNMDLDTLVQGEAVIRNLFEVLPPAADGIKPICIEITEPSYVDPDDTGVGAMRRLIEAGIPLLLDDVADIRHVRSVTCHGICPFGIKVDEGAVTHFNEFVRLRDQCGIRLLIAERMWNAPVGYSHVQGFRWHPPILSRELPVAPWCTIEPLVPAHPRYEDHSSIADILEDQHYRIL